MPARIGKHKSTPHRVNGRGHDTEGVTSMLDAQYSPTELDWAWAAGLFEGEGCISHGPVPGKCETRRWIQIDMCDRDVLERFWRIVGSGNEPYEVIRDNPNHKNIWHWKCSSWPEVERILLKILPLLGERRAAKARELLADPAGTPNGEKTHCAQGHEYAPENTRVRIRDGYPRRECRTCENARRRRYYHRTKPKPTYLAKGE